MERNKDPIETTACLQDTQCLTNSETGWENEALCVIKDVQDHVKSIFISKIIKVMLN